MEKLPEGSGLLESAGPLIPVAKARGQQGHERKRERRSSHPPISASAVSSYEISAYSYFLIPNLQRIYIHSCELKLKLNDPRRSLWQ